MSDRTISYRPGSWFGIVGEHATVLLPGTEKARAGALWLLVDDGAGFDAVLDALLADGLSSLPGFVLVASDAETTRVVIRGAAAATFQAAEGEVRVAVDEGAMWAERTLHRVTRLSVAIPEEPATGPVLSVVDGLVRLGALEAPAAEPAAAEPAGRRLAPVVELVPESARRPDPLTDPLHEPLDDLPAPEDEAPEPDRAGDRSDEREDELADRSAGEPADDTTGEAGLGAPPAWTPAPPPPVGFPVVPPPPPVPPVVPPVPAAPPAPSTPPAPAAGWDDQATEQIPAMPGPLEPPPGPPAVPQDRAAAAPAPEAERSEGDDAVAHLSFSSGDEIDVAGLVVIGRAPDAGRFPADEQPLLVAVPSPHSEISSTHVEVRPGTGDDHGRAVVTDLGSTNGTLLVQPGQRPEELRPGVPVVLETGALIDLGDGLTIRVTGV